MIFSLFVRLIANVISPYLKKNKQQKKQKQHLFQLYGRIKLVNKTARKSYIICHIFHI